MAELLYVGMTGGIEDRVVPRAGIPLVSLPLVTPDHWARFVPALAALARGLARCLLTFRRFQPRVLFSTGGFVSLPATVAAWLMRTPIVIFLPDVKPGRTVRYACRLSRRVAVSSEDSLRYLPKPATVTGYPVRQSFLDVDRNSARSGFGLAEDDLQLLVMGGSLGAASINRTVARGLGVLLPVARIVHICGTAHTHEMESVRSKLPIELRRRYTVLPYLEEDSMARAMAASDLAITRGGASILGELPAVGIPAIVVPLPVPHVGQEANAAVLETHNACFVMSNHHAESGELVHAALALLQDAPLRLSMAHAMSELARPAAAATIARIVLDTAEAA